MNAFAVRINTLYLCLMQFEKKIQQIHSEEENVDTKYHQHLLCWKSTSEHSQRQTARRTELVGWLVGSNVTNAKTKNYEMKNDNGIPVAYIAARARSLAIYSL